MFDILVICYLFLGGAGAGALIFLSLLEIITVSNKPRTVNALRPWYSLLPREFFVRAWSICFAVLLFAILCLMFDLGRIDRLLSLVTSPTPSTLTIGAYSLLASLVCAAFFAISRLFDTVSLSKIGFGVIAFFGILVGVVTAVYTGILLSSMASILFWQNPLLPLLFLLSSLSTGIALLFLGMVFTDVRSHFIKAIKAFARIDAVIIIFELLCIAVYFILDFIDPVTQSTIIALIFTEMSWLFWIGLIGCGLIVPFVLEQYISSENYRNQLLWIAFLVLIGGALLRVCIVEAASYDITQTSTLSTNPIMALQSIF